MQIGHIQDVDVRHFHLFCGLGGGAKGFNRSTATVNGLRARMRCIGGVDVSPAAIRDFDKLSDSRGTVLDMFDREQYKEFHECEPPSDWVEATPDDIRRAAGGEFPNIVFLSAPCKGFSGLLSETRSKTGKYQALNRLTLRGVWLMLEAFRDSLPELIIFENVPRIATRGRNLLDQIGSMLRAYGYAVAETFHDCGELGELAQSRKRFLMVARHTEKVPPFLYEPPKRTLRAVGDVLSRFPMPGDPRGGPMHLLPNLQWKTWVRLAFVEAGSDWRSLNKLRVADGHLQDFVLVPGNWYGDTLGVQRWEDTSGTITGMAAPTRGAFAVADPRFEGGQNHYSQYGVQSWSDTSGVVTGQGAPGQGPISIADPRLLAEGRYNNVYRIQRWDEASQAISGGTGPSAGGLGIADPRPAWENRYGNLAVCDYDKPCGTVIAGGKGVQGGWLSVADPRPGGQKKRGDAYLTNGHYGVVGFNETCGAVSAAASTDNGRWNVADPRIDALPAANDKLVAIIRSMDGTWHRPFTTLELAALQSLIDPDDIFDLDGDGDGAKRERIGNAVPPRAATAIGDVMAHTLLLAWSGETFSLSAMPIWVSPVAVALSVRPAEISA